MNHHSRYYHYHIIVYFKTHSGSDLKEIRIKSQ